MIENLEDNPLDKFFRDSIESSEAKPSEQFWNKAYESIIAREGRMNRKRIVAWRSAAILLCALIMGLISYNVYISGKVNNLGKEVTNIEKFQSASTNSNIASAPNNNLPEKTTSNNDNPNGVSSPPASPLALTSKPVEKSESARENRTATSSMPHTLQIASVTPNRNIVANNSDNLVNSTVSAPVNTISNSTVTASTVQVNQTSVNAPVVNTSAANTPLANTNLAPLKSDDNPVASNLLPVSNVNFPEVGSSDESTMPDSVFLSEPNPAEKAKSYFVDVMVPKFSISGFFSSNNNGLTVMNGYNPLENINASQLNANEHELFAFSSGFNIGYDLSSRITVQAGCNYQQYQFSIAPTTLNPIPALGVEPSIGYSLETSSGYVYLPNLPCNPKPIGATTVTAQGTALRSYFNIPAQLKWNFINEGKLKIYATAGASMNVLSINKATIGWENAYGKQSETVNGIEGTNNLTCSYLVGLGTEYKLFRGFAVYFEYTYSGALNPVNEDSYINVKSNFTSLIGGVKYHL
jgi:opacity protein-like surface antigen